MISLFEVQLALGIDGKTVVSAETIQETQAQLITYAELIKLGFTGVNQPGLHENIIWIAVARRDSRWIHRSLETSDNVINFRIHEVD
jgi:hypothetical protein